MAFSSNQGARIHYELEGDGPPLLLQHGFTDSLQTWYELGYVEALQRQYRLVLVDARGHGSSDKPHQIDAYSMENRVADIVAVLRDLGIARVHFFGYSMGGWIGFGMARHEPDRIDRLIIGGAAGTPHSRQGLILKALTEGGTEIIPTLVGARISPTLRGRLLANDVEALKASRIDHPGFGDSVATMMMPCLI